MRNLTIDLLWNRSFQHVSLNILSVGRRAQVCHSAWETQGIPARAL